MVIALPIVISLPQGSGMEKNEDSSTFSVEMNDAGTVGDAARAEGAPKLSKNQMKRLAKVKY